MLSLLPSMETTLFPLFPCLKAVVNSLQINILQLSGLSLKLEVDWAWFGPAHVL